MEQSIYDPKIQERVNRAVRTARQKRQPAIDRQLYVDTVRQLENQRELLTELIENEKEMIPEFYNTKSLQVQAKISVLEDLLFNADRT